jgi:hypothetical protein
LNVGGNKKIKLNSLNETLEWKDGRVSLRDFLHIYRRMGALSLSILYWAEIGVKRDKTTSEVRE